VRSPLQSNRGRSIFRAKLKNAACRRKPPAPPRNHSWFTRRPSHGHCSNRAALNQAFCSVVPEIPGTLTPLTLLLFGTLAGYYSGHAIGLLRWSARNRNIARPGGAP